MAHVSIFCIHDFGRFFLNPNVGDQRVRFLNDSRTDTINRSEFITVRMHFATRWCLQKNTVETGQIILFLSIPILCIARWATITTN